MALSPPQERYPVLKSLLVCFSLANLFLVSAWYGIQDLQAPFADYFRDAPPDLTILKATLLAALVLTVAFVAAWIVASLLPRWGRLWDCIFLAALAVALEMARAEWLNNTLTEHIRNAAGIAAEAAVLFGLLLAAFKNKRFMVEAARRMLLLLNFLFLALGIHFLTSWAATPPASAFASDSAAPPATKTGPPVLWLLFDSLDQRMTFDARHPSLQLPELDRLRDRSLWAAEAYPPARYTSYSIPALLNGRLFEAAKPEGPDRTMLTPRGGGPPVNWTAIPSIFSDVRKLGLDTRVTGWYHPYCRLFGRDLVGCHTELGVDGRPTKEFYAARLGLAGAVRLVLEQRKDELLAAFGLAKTKPTELRFEAFAKMRLQEQYFGIRKHALETLPKFSSGLYFIHWPVPHPPALYDRRRQSFDLKPDLNYLDNLALVDRTLEELRRTLEAQGLWEKYTIILTSDHGYRPEFLDGPGFNQEMDEAVGGSKSLTVPVLIRFPGQKKSLRYGPKFNNALLHDLVIAVLRREVTTPEQASHWLDRNHERLPTTPPQPIP